MAKYKTGDYVQVSGPWAKDYPTKRGYITRPPYKSCGAYIVEDEKMVSASFLFDECDIRLIPAIIISAEDAWKGLIDAAI